MSRGDFGYGSTGREYTDDPLRAGGNSTGSESSSAARGPGYQGYGTYNELVDKVTSNIFTINNNATTLDRSTKQIATEKDSVQLRDKIHATEQSTNRIVNDTTKLFRQLSTLSGRSDRQKKLQYERLASEFRETLQRYHVLQKKAAEKVRTTAPLPSLGKPRPSDLINWGEEGDDEARLVESEHRRQQLQAQEQAVDVDMALMQEREEQIHQLESDILDINEIFRDLGTLVHEQGEVIDSIEQNVETAYGHVDAGRQQLGKASTYQSKARKKMCILVVILLIVAAVIGLIIYLSVR